MKDYIFGANILENITTGMYQDSKVIYREYIQNACDQIDKAVREGLLAENEGFIHIWLETDTRSILIEDNATGISATDFMRILGNIADSDKKIGEDKGFRGIGRLCGLAYCKELVFSSTVKGETTVSTMRCDAQKMRNLLSENVQGKKHTANFVLNTINKFSTSSSATRDEHWFKVELIGINSDNTDLLDFLKIKEYLSFVAPVSYINTFIFRSEIYKYAKEIDYHIDEYNIRINGELITKKYKSNFKTRKGEDEIFKLKFKNIKNDDGDLIAWIWFGLSRFKGVIQSDYKMRGLRLRKENIQIGSEDTLQKLFKDDRGNHYFIGEVFAIHKDLIPNSQRDYFNENTIRNQFEKELKKYFDDDLRKLYYDGSAINSAFYKIELADKKEADYQAKLANGEFNDIAHKEAEIEEVKKSLVLAEKAKAEIEKKRQQKNPLLVELMERIEIVRNKNDVRDGNNTLQKANNTTTLSPKENESKPVWRVDRLSEYNKKERKLISKIFSIILASTEKGVAETIIKKIEDEL